MTVNKAEAWINSLRRGGEFDQIFDYLPEVLFFAKNLDGEMMRCNRAFLRHCGFQEERELLGKTDYKVFPKFMADKFRRDDAKVITSRQPLLNIVEIFPSINGIPMLHLTNKFPVFDQAGEVCGVCGTVRMYENSQRVIQPYLDIEKAVEHIKKHYAEPLSVTELAAKAGLSVRQFERKFQKIFHSTPRAHILKIRILQAAELLSNTRLSITEIALRTGFYDHCSFTRQFRRHMNQTPLAYRRAHESTAVGRV